MTLIAQDVNGNEIQALALRNNDGCHQISVGATTARNATAFNDGTKVVYLYSDTDCFIEFGDNTVEATASRHFLPANIYVAIATKSHTHIAAIQSTASGTLYISETA